LLRDETIQEAVEVAERYADGVVDEVDLRQANRRMVYDPAMVQAAAFLTSVPRYDRPSVLHRYGIVDLTCLDEEAQRRVESICSSGLRFPVDVALDVARMAVALNPLAEARTQSTFVRDIFGNPLRPLQPLAPSLMTWNDGLIPRLASASYE